MVRRAIAAAGGLVLIILFFLFVKSCRENAREDAFRNYGRDVAALVQESDQASQQLFGLLTRPGRRSPLELQQAVNGYHSDAAQLVDRARDTDHPDELDTAQRWFVESLQFRRDGIERIARELPTALGDQGREEATARITVTMRSFLTSDVLYSDRFIPHLTNEVKKQKLTGEVNIPRSRFLPDLQWLRPTVVAERIDAIRGGGGGTGTAAPGLHGTALVSVTAKPGGKALVPGGATDIAVSPRLSFDVAVSNGGEHEERDVTVSLSIAGAGKPLVRDQRLPSIKPGEQKTVSIPLAATPTTGRPVTITVEVKPVPGEKKVDNNKQRYPAIFTR
ncbi:MAG TPA: CARDB domain-containing protein [Thermoleophilaceae bacterium]|jgi:hypothetical protein